MSQASVWVVAAGCRDFPRTRDPLHPDPVAGGVPLNQSPVGECAQPAFHGPDAPTRVKIAGIGNDGLEVVQRRLVDPVVLVEQRFGHKSHGYPVLARLEGEIGVLSTVTGIPFIKSAQSLDPGHAEYRPTLAKKLHVGAKSGLWELQAHEYFSEPELFTYLASLDACVLPYRFGTHSGWLEAALDVGTPVAVPDCGHYADQDASVAQFRLSPTGVDEDSLLNAVEELLLLRGLPGLDAAGRRRQRLKIARAHREIYEALVDGARPAR